MKWRTKLRTKLCGEDWKSIVSRDILLHKSKISVVGRDALAEMSTTITRQYDYGLLALAIESILSCFVFVFSLVGNPSKHNDCKSGDRSYTAVMNCRVCGHNQCISRYLWSTSYRRS